MKSKLLEITFVVLLLVSCSGKNTDTISLRQEWFPNANYAGEIVGAKEFSEKEGVKFNIEAGSDNIDPIKLVISGQNDIGVSGADKVLLANEKGADLVVIGVINYNSPVCFISKKEKNIKTPEDFISKKIGVLTGTATELVYKALLDKSNISKSEINEMEVPFDLSTFVADEYDVRPAFIYDEPVSLDLQDIKYDIIDPNDYGVSFIGTVYFTTRKNIIENPERIQKFIDIVCEGWEKSLESPDLAIKYLKEYDSSIDTNRELKSLKKGLSYFEGFDNKVLFSDLKHWKDMVKTMNKLGMISGTDYDKTLDMTFVQKYYDNKQ